ncbi:MAG: hypothetical protein Q8O17_03740 [Candidatus Methanoperedens sp.]|jgi:hypothetical protein|nr:hypothetical protein [Candidatus Methanoperedens sp.]
MERELVIGRIIKEFLEQRKNIPVAISFSTDKQHAKNIFSAG